MNTNFELTVQEFNNQNIPFKTLEINSKQAIGMNHAQLSNLITKQYKKLALVNHPDKGGTKDRFHEIDNAKNLLMLYIKPLESGNPCTKVDINAETNGLLTLEEFKYRQGLFERLGISKEAIGKDFKWIESQLEKNLIQSYLQKGESKSRYDLVEDPVAYSLLRYISPLEEKKNLIDEDKKELVSELLQRKQNVLAFVSLTAFFLPVLNTITIGCYFSWWIIALNLISGNAVKLLIDHYNKQYTDSKISTDEFNSKIRYISLGSKFLVVYPLAAFSVYLVTTNFIAHGLTIGGTVLGTLLFAALMIEVLVPVFFKGCEIYTEKHLRDLTEEDSKHKVQKETDLLEQYEPRRLFMPIIMPIVRKCFAEFGRQLSERNFDSCEATRTDMSDVKTEQKIPQGISASVNP